MGGTSLSGSLDWLEASPIPVLTGQLAGPVLAPRGDRRIPAWSSPALQSSLQKEPPEPAVASAAPGCPPAASASPRGSLGSAGGSDPGFPSTPLLLPSVPECLLVCLHFSLPDAPVLVLVCFLFVEFLILLLDHFPGPFACCVLLQFSEHLWMIILNSLWAIPGSPFLWGPGTGEFSIFGTLLPWLFVTLYCLVLPHEESVTLFRSHGLTSVRRQSPAGEDTWVRL